MYLSYWDMGMGVGYIFYREVSRYSLYLRCIVGYVCLFFRRK